MPHICIFRGLIPDSSSGPRNISKITATPLPDPELSNFRKSTLEYKVRNVGERNRQTQVDHCLEPFYVEPMNILKSILKIHQNLRITIIETSESWSTKVLATQSAADY